MVNEFETPQPEKQKINPTLIYGILVAALLGTWGYILYDKSKTKEQVTALTNQNATVTSEKDEVRELYNASLSRLDSLMGENQTLNQTLSGTNQEISNLKNEIRKIVSNKNASAADLARARKMIGELNGRIENLAAEVDKLKGENEQLVNSNQKISAEKQQVEQSLAATTTEKEAIKKSLDETSDIASTLHASNINITPINERGGGKEKTTTTAKKVDKLRISFDLDPNKLAPTGEKELFVAITAPDGKAVAIPGGGSANFTTREDGEKFFSTKVGVQYDNLRRIPVSFDWRQDKDYQTGNYKIEVYHNGFKIGEAVRNLKKGGLF
jgi:regulator of replication initiation timing